jgi:hypothetical protein
MHFEVSVSTAYLFFQAPLEIVVVLAVALVAVVYVMTDARRRNRWRV